MEEPSRLQSMGSLESDVTERLHFHFSLSCIGEGNGNPLQCSCLENARDGEAWWAAIYGVAQSLTRLKRLSSSSSMILLPFSKLSCFFSVGLSLLVCFPPKEVPLAFVIKLVWLCWILSTFAGLESFWFLHQIWMRVLLGRVFLVVNHFKYVVPFPSGL